MSASSEQEFGKDFGLIHEVIVTGRKVGADRDFWIVLAHNEKKFREVVELIFPSNKDLKIAPIPFDPSFIGEGWKIISEEEDERSAKLTEVDFSKAKFVHCLKKRETLIKGEEKFRRLKQSKDIRLGASVFMALWQDYQAKKENSVLERLFQAGSIKSYLDFFGTIFLDPGTRHVLCLCRHDDGSWYWRARWLEHDWDVKDLSVVFPQV